jgi:hypothetical protein
MVTLVPLIVTTAKAEDGPTAPGVERGASTSPRRGEPDETSAPTGQEGVDRLSPALRELGRGGASYVGSFAAGTLLNRVQVSASALPGENDHVLVGVAASDLHFANPIALTGGRPRLASDFYSVRLLGQYARQLADQRTFATMLQVGSASDRPFSRWDVITVGGGASLSFPSGEHGRWLLSLSLSNNSPLVNYIPIPGVAYSYRTRTFSAVVGFPYTLLSWRPTDRWTYAASASAASVNGEVAHSESRAVQEFVGCSWGRTQSYLRADRTDASDRLVLEEGKAAGGIRFPVLADIFGELQVGYAFGRSIYETSGSGLAWRNQGPKTALGSGWLAGWSMRLTY